MSDSTQINLRVKVETVERLKKLCEILFRSKGAMIDYLVAKELGAILGGGIKPQYETNEEHLFTVLGEPEAEKAAG